MFSEAIIQIAATLMIFIIGYKTAMFIWLKWFSETVYQYYEIGKDGERIPVIFEFKGKEIKLNIERKHLDNPVGSYRDLTINIFCINDKMVMTLSELKGLWFTKRWIDLNMDYDTKDVFKILRKYRKLRSEEWNKQYKEKARERSIY